MKIQRLQQQSLLAVLLCLVHMAPVGAQAMQEPTPLVGPPSWAAELTGYWESVISQNWRLRMVTPPKGDYVGIPLNSAAQKIADAWDPERDSRQGEQCRSYGAAMVMLNPGHLRISWKDAKTLNVDIDNGNQSRQFHFDEAPLNAAPTWQGTSSAAWIQRRSIAARPGRAPVLDPEARYLEVKTTRLRPGYLRKNGVPYSAAAQVVEYFDLIHAPGGVTWLVVTTTVTDPEYLDYPLIMTAHFRKQPNGSLWDPTPCSSTW